MIDYPVDFIPILNHIKKYFGEEGFLIQHNLPEVRTKMIILPPNKERNYSIYITIGMSEQPMFDLPDLRYLKGIMEGDKEQTREAFRDNYAELMVKLPPDWPLPNLAKGISDDEYYWPIQRLFELVDYVHEQHKFFGHGHTFGYDKDFYFSNNTKLAGWCFIHPPYTPQAFAKLKISNTKIISFLQLIPLYIEEILFAERHGTETLIQKLKSENINDYIDLNRKNTCATTDSRPTRGSRASRVSRAPLFTIIPKERFMLNPRRIREYAAKNLKASLFESTLEYQVNMEQRLLAWVDQLDQTGIDMNSPQNNPPEFWDDNIKILQLLFWSILLDYRHPFTGKKYSMEEFFTFCLYQWKIKQGQVKKYDCQFRSLIPLPQEDFEELMRRIQTDVINEGNKWYQNSKNVITSIIQGKAPQNWKNDTDRIAFENYALRDKEAIKLILLMTIPGVTDDPSLIE